MNEKLVLAIKIIKQGGVVIFPTDTAMAIGGRIDKQKTVERIFKIKKRPVNEGLPVLVDTVGMAERLVEKIPQEVLDKLIEAYWPGALTIVLPCQTDKVLPLVRGNKNTLAVRIPNHRLARTLIRESHLPLIGTSANLHGQPTPYRHRHLDKELTKKVDLVITGECPLQKESTIIDCSRKPWRIVRQGAVEILDIRY